MSRIGAQRPPTVQVGSEPAELCSTQRNAPCSSSRLTNGTWLLGETIGARSSPKASLVWNEPTTGVMQASRVNELQSSVGLPSPSLSTAGLVSGPPRGGGPGSKLKDSRRCSTPTAKPKRPPGRSISEPVRLAVPTNWVLNERGVE